MAETGFAAFSTTVDKTNHVLRLIEEAYGWPKERRHQSYAALRAVLHALRDRLSVSESAQLAAQLPMLIRGIFYEGWDPGHVPMRMTKEQFLQRVRSEVPYVVKGGMEPLVQTVIRALGSHVTEGEWENVRAGMPREMSALIP